MTAPAEAILKLGEWILQIVFPEVYTLSDSQEDLHLVEAGAILKL